MGDRKTYLTKLVSDFSKRLDEKGFTANHDGNITVRFENFFLATPTAESKASITPEMVILLDPEGKKIEGIGKPFSEIKLHQAAYKARPETQAIVHAHPPFATARGLVGKNLNVSLPEAVVSIGHLIPVAPFAMPGAKENDQIISKMVGISDVFMLAGNGVIAIGADLEQAYLRLELLEHLCKIDYYAMSMGTPMTLNENDLQSLLTKRAQLGLGPQKKTEQSSSPSDQDLKALIAEEIKKILSK